jgi:hypothetical protein
MQKLHEPDDFKGRDAQNTVFVHGHENESRDHTFRKGHNMALPSEEEEKGERSTRRM